MLRTQWFRLLCGITLFFCLLAGSVIYRNLPRPPLNAILITLGTTRADHLGCYGYQRAQTPALDALAKNGGLFEKAYTSVPLTLPAHTTMFTSLYPPEHGLRINGQCRLGDDVPVLAEILKNQKYHTGAFLASFALNSKFGLSRGFDTYDDAFEAANTPQQSQPARRDGKSVMDAALEWLNQRRTQPFFCWIHLADPHFPYNARREIFGEAFAERPYDAGIAFADLQIKRLTEFLQRHRLSKQTLIVVVGDHGEGLMEHGESQHGRKLFNSTLRVPLIVAGPDFIMPGIRVAAPVSHVDVAPTILLGLGFRPAMPRYRGIPLLAALAGKPVSSRVFHIETRLAFEEGHGNILVGLVSADAKYITGAEPELYNLVQDPGEMINVAAAQEMELRRNASLLRDGQQNMQLRDAPFVQLTSAEKSLLRIDEFDSETIGTPISPSPAAPKSE